MVIGHHHLLDGVAFDFREAREEFVHQTATVTTFGFFRAVLAFGTQSFHEGRLGIIVADNVIAGYNLYRVKPDGLAIFIKEWFSVRTLRGLLQVLRYGHHGVPVKFLVHGILDMPLVEASEFISERGIEQFKRTVETDCCRTDKVAHFAGVHFIVTGTCAGNDERDIKAEQCIPCSLRTRLRLPDVFLFNVCGSNDLLCGFVCLGKLIVEVGVAVKHGLFPFG